MARCSDRVAGRHATQALSTPGVWGFGCAVSSIELEAQCPPAAKANYIPAPSSDLLDGEFYKVFNNAALGFGLAWAFAGFLKAVRKVSEAFF